MLATVLTFLKRRRGYVIPLAAMSGATALTLLLQPFFSGHSANTLLYVLAALASAWFGGYGPGLLACLLGLLVAPYFFTAHFDPRKIDAIRAVLVLAASVLISYVGDRQRRTTAALREANRKLKVAHDSLEDRVHERTAELQKSNDDLHKLNAALNEFAYSASHDLQQPLRTMATQSQMLQRRYYDRLDAQANECIRLVVRGAREMNQLLSDLLTYARSVNAMPREGLAVDANSILRDALHNLQSAIEESGAQIIAGHLPETSMHRFHLLELFQNLIGNAIKYRGDEPIRIEIAYERSPESRVAIRDNGIGIAPEYATQVFGLFKRLHSSERYDGTGVGLAICEAIVERYGGRIWIEPNLPKGSTFFFTLPAIAQPAPQSQTIAAKS